MRNLNKNLILHKLFLAGLVLKFIDGIFELAGGIFLIFIKSDFIYQITQIIFEHEIAQDPTDLIANYLIHASQNIVSGTLTFASIYLIIHGCIKITLVLGVLLNRLWAYPLVGIILSLSVIYQLIRFFNTNSLVLLLFTIIDIFILFMLKREYRKLRLTN